MARAYIVLARNDLDDNLLQVLDLSPNKSQRNSVYAGAGQTHYQTHFLLDAVNAAVATQAGLAGGASLDSDGDTYGLSAYLIDNVEDTLGTQALTAVEAGQISALIEQDASNGVALTLAAINIHINTPAGVGGSDLDGILGASTGSVEEVLRILAGERWKLPDNSQVQVVGGTFDAAVRGFFTTAANIEQPESVRALNGAGIRGRNPFSGRVVPTTAVVNTGTQDGNHNQVLPIVNTGALQLSALSGVLSELVAPAFTFLNPAFTYGAGGTATDLDGVAIPATGAHRAVTVYAADGTVIA
jgi:hypothetical protein